MSYNWKRFKANERLIDSLTGERGTFINTGYIAKAELGKQIDLRIVAALRYCLASLRIWDDFSY